MRMPHERPFDGAACHRVSARRNAAFRLPDRDVTPLFQFGTSPSHSETSVAARWAARETAQTIREDHFALPKVAEEDGAEPQANRNPGEVNSMLGFIVEIIGEEAAAKLIARFGGTRLYVPHSPCPDDALALAVGTGAAMKLAEMFGGERVELPKPPPRRMQILTLRAAGRSVEEIGRALN
jgi:hypothetical protein